MYEQSVVNILTLVCDERILLSDKLIFASLAQVGKLKFGKILIFICNNKLIFSWTEQVGAKY